MGLNVLFVIIMASMSLGFIIGVILARPRRWDIYICADDTVHAEATGDTGS
jgi:hypothetical protein